jgi:hypothetical protein
MRAGGTLLTLLGLTLPAASIGLTGAASGQTLPANLDKIAQTFQSFPAGGKGLVTSVAALALESAANVKPICLTARQGPLLQQFAAAAGLRRAYDMASTNGNTQLATTIQTEVAECGDASATAFAGGDGETGAAADGPRVAIPTGPLAGTVPVSPSKP